MTLPYRSSRARCLSLLSTTLLVLGLFAGLAVRTTRPAAAADGLPDLRISMTDAPDPVVGGGTLSYTLGVRNGPLPSRCSMDPYSVDCDGASAWGVVVRATLDSRVTVQSATGTNGFACTVAGSVVTCSGGTIFWLASASITIKVTVPTVTSQTTLMSSAVVDPSDAIAESDETNNSASTTTTVNPNVDLTIGMTASPNPARVNQPLSFTVTVQNTGTAPAADVTVSQRIDRGNFIPTNGYIASVGADSGFTCTFKDYLESFTAIVTCSNGSIVAGGRGTITVTVNPWSSWAGTYTITSSATVDPNNTIAETNETNNTASFAVSVQP